MTDLPVRAVDLGRGVRAAFTRGWSEPGCIGAGFNLLPALEDEPGAVATRLRAVEEWIGTPVVRMRQVHGNAVHVCGPAPGPATADAGDADALVATGSERAVAVLVADCVPVLLADADAGVVAAVHAGRRGLVAEIIGAAVAAMAEQGGRPGQTRAVVGPAICGACYEVPTEMRDEVAATVPESASTTAWGTPAIDLPAGVLAQLRAAGVARIDLLGECTLEDDRWFSHRATSAGRPPGRFAGIIRALG